MIILKPIEEIKFTPDYEAGEPVFLEMFESTMLEMQVWCLSTWKKLIYEEQIPHPKGN